MDYPRQNRFSASAASAQGPLPPELVSEATQQPTASVGDTTRARFAVCPLCGCRVELMVQRSNRVRGVTWKDRMAYHLRCHEVADATREGKRAGPAPEHEVY